MSSGASTGSRSPANTARSSRWPGRANEAPGYRRQRLPRRLRAARGGPARARARHEGTDAMTGNELALLARTAVHLQPAQVAHRARLRAQRRALRRWPEAGRRLLVGPDPGTAVGWPTAFRPLDSRTPHHWPGLNDVRDGNLGLLGTTRNLGDPIDWQHADAPQLWRFHLHYWDWTWGLA